MSGLRIRSADVGASRIAHADLNELALSFEFFPPKVEKTDTQFWDELLKLELIRPQFVSVTYGAGGSTQERTHDIVARLALETSLRPAAHLTCVDATREEVDRIAARYWDAGVRHIVALRGDPPAGAGAYLPHPDGYAYAADLVAGLKRVADFEISVAAYPEIHPEAASAACDLDNLKRKLDAGADRAITQFFFNPECYFRFLDSVRAAGIEAPIVPGILPILNFERTVEFAKKCGSSIPRWLATLFSNLDDDPKIRDLVAAVAAAEQCRQLRAHGIKEFHFYTLNRIDLTLAICRTLLTPVLDTEGTEQTVKAGRLA
jgi:methylenetetrahydrofolate reductase (NADPH)